MSSKFLLPYYPMVDFLADFLGKSTEVVLHDFTDLEHSVVKIRNGHISGRKEGDPATDLVMKKLNSKGTETFLCNYKSLSKDKKAMKSGSFFIRDDKNKIVGMLCLNTNVESLLAAQQFLSSFLGKFSDGLRTEPNEDTSENLGQSINEIIDSSIERALACVGNRENGLSMAEREQVVTMMNDEGVFLFKGAVSKAAAALDISESSLYRYLKKVRSN